jgi:cephalosporin-C deacetylase
MAKDDLDNFWNQTLRELAEIPMDARLEPAPEHSGREYTTFRVTLTSWDEIRIRAWYSVPKDVPRGTFSAVMTAPGYSGNKPIPIHLVQQGYAVLTLYPRAQGESQAEWELENGTKLTYHITDKNRYYYRGAYADCVRGIDFLVARQEIDSGRIGMWGRSQGGGLTLVTASLDDRLKAAVAEEPFLCNYPIAIETVKTHPYVELNEYLKSHPSDRSNTLETLAWFDPISLVAHITCPVLMNIGMKDETCPFRTIMPVFEKIQSPKALMIYPELGHSPCTDFNNHAKNWLDQYL